MAITVEARLRVPSLAVTGENGKTTINNQAVRFHKMIEVDAIPKTDDKLRLSTASGVALPSTVVRADWEEDRQLFVVSCRYAGARITNDDFMALVSDSQWTKTELPT